MINKFIITVSNGVCVSSYRGRKVLDNRCISDEERIAQCEKELEEVILLGDECDHKYELVITECTARQLCELKLVFGILCPALCQTQTQGWGKIVMWDLWEREFLSYQVYNRWCWSGMQCAMSLDDCLSKAAEIGCVFFQLSGLNTLIFVHPVFLSFFQI